MNKARRERIERRKKDKAWSLAVRTPNECVVCHITTNIDAHHLLPKERWPQYRYDLINGIALCKYHHKFGKFSAHKNPLWFAIWMERNRISQFLYILSLNTEEEEKANSFVTNE